MPKYISLELNNPAYFSIQQELEISLKEAGVLPSLRSVISRYNRSLKNLRALKKLVTQHGGVVNVSSDGSQVIVTGPESILLQYAGEEDSLLLAPEP